MSERSSNRVSFASCNSQYYEQVLWKAILARDPSVFIWGGDTVYADVSDKDPAPPDRIEQLYKEQKLDPGYQELLSRKIPILGVLDDHNYGINNGDRTYPYRTASGRLFACDFLEQQGTAFCDRAKNGKGVYAVKVMDFHRPKGQELLTDEEAGLDPDVPISVQPETNSNNPQPSVLSDRSVAIFLLDVRSNSSPITKHGLDSAHYDGDLLGEDQWKWFEAAIGKSTAAVNIVVQGIQVHTDKLASADRYETWSNFPASQHRLYQAMLQDHVKAPILVSGDVHLAQLLRKDCQLFHHHATKQQAEPVSQSKPKMLLEVTSSGMTHSWGASWGGHICARPRSLFLCRTPHVRWAAKLGMHLGQWINGKKVWTELVDLSSAAQTDETMVVPAGEGKLGLQYELNLNFGEFEFDWANKAVSIRIFGKQVDAPPLLSTRLYLDSLSGTRNDIQVAAEEDYFVETYNRLESNGGFTSNAAVDNQWICVNYRGRHDPVSQVAGIFIPFGAGAAVAGFPFIAMILAIRRYLGRRKVKQS